MTEASTVQPDPSPVVDVDAVIVGAGFAGLYMLHRFRRMGLSARVIERASDVGGTWYWNRYPGARCDVESMVYSYSWDPELEQEWNWTERYAAQPEILRYIEHVADRHDLRRDISFDTSVIAAHFDETSDRWAVATDLGDRYSCRFVIAAVGCLSHPKQVDIDGLDDFAGETYHTSSWPHHDLDLSGKRIAVIGTGSTGIQAIPELAKVAGHLTVFQRTPNFSAPARNRPLTDDEIAERKAAYAEYREMLRHSFSGNHPSPSDGAALAKTPEEREAWFEERWEIGRPTAIVGAYDDILTDIEANEYAAQFVRDRIAEMVDDPDLARTLQPTSYPIGTKRPCLDTDYFATYNRPNVTLVDVRATPIERITESGIRTTDTEREFDVIVFATGFDAMVGALNNIDIRGRDDALLRDEWADGPVSYLGLAVAGFPNLFTVTGPGSPSVLSNMIISIEQHVDWIADCVTHLDRHRIATIEPTAEAQAAWVDRVREVAAGTLYPEAASWYMGANVPGKPRVFLPYVGGVGEYREICDRVAADGYDGFVLA